MTKVRRYLSVGVSTGIGLFTLVFFAVMGISVANSAAALYDDFSGGTTIDTTKWTSVLASGLFSQHDGRLYVSASSTNTRQGLHSVPFTGNFTATMEFYNFSTASNLSWVFLGLGPKENQVNIMRGRDGFGQDYFLAGRINTVSGQVFEGWFGNTPVSTDGQLRLSYENGAVSTYYNKTLDQDTGWILLGSFTPGWSATYEPAFMVGGKNGGTGTTSFQVDNVTATPLPSAVFLMVPGLAGLVAMRRRLISSKRV
jgi:hypothetical protein